MSKVMLVRPKRTQPAYKASSSVESTPSTTTPKKDPPLPPLLRGGYKGGPFGDKNLREKSPTEPSVESLLEQTTGLSVDQKKALLDRLALELQAEKTTKKDSNRDLDMWATGLLQAISKVVVGHSYGILLIKKTVGTTAHWTPVHNFMEQSRLATCSVTERQGVYNLLADLVVASAMKAATYAGAPLSLKVVANCTNNVASCFESAFPGYLASGLAKVVVKQMTATR